MAASKNILRSLIVMALVLGMGFLGLWFLGGNQIKVKNLGPRPTSPGNETDRFSDVGGKTPQETIRLLAAALEKSDLVLAVKYFVPENREVESEDLTKLYKANLLSDLVKDLRNLNNGKTIDDIRYRFEVPDENGGAAAEIDLIKNNKGFWKVLML